MRYFAKTRRVGAVIVLAVLATAGVIGAVHAVQAGPDYTGGLGPAHVVVRPLAGGMPVAGVVRP